MCNSLQRDFALSPTLNTHSTWITQPCHCLSYVLTQLMHVTACLNTHLPLQIPFDQAVSSCQASKQAIYRSCLPSFLPSHDIKANTSDPIDSTYATCLPRTCRAVLANSHAILCCIGVDCQRYNADISARNTAILCCP